MIGAAAAYVSGLFFASFFFDSTSILLALSAVVILAVYGKIRSFKAVDYIIIALFFAGAVAVNRCYTHFVYDKITSYAQTEGSFSGEIIDYTEHNRDLASYTLKGSINDNCNARLNIFTNTIIDAELGDTVEIESCRFVLPERDYIFDGMTYNKSRHIYLEGEKISGISLKKAENPPISRYLRAYREKMTERMIINMTGDTGAVLSGMVFGGSDDISEQTETALYSLGIGHILSVSGLHVSAIGAVIMGFLKRLRLNKYLRFALLNIVLFLLTAMADYPVSAVRAAMMLDIFYLAEIFGQQSDSLNSISIAALIICLFDCYAVYSTGFILSFCGTYGIAVFAPYMAKNISSENSWGTAAKSAVSAVCVSVAVMPASIYFFDEVSLISPLANIVFLPVCTFAMICGFLFVITGGVFTFILLPAELLLTTFLAASQYISRLDFLNIPRFDHRLPMIFIFGAVAVAAVYLFSRNRKAVANSAALISCGVIIASFGTLIISGNRPVIAVLGEEKSAAVVISCNGESIVVDLKGDNEDYVEKYLTQKGTIGNYRVLLTENIPRDEVSYSKGFKFPPQQLYTCTEGIKGFENPLYKAEFSDGALVVTVENFTIAFVSEDKAEQTGADVYFIYGKVKNGKNLPENSCIISDNGNNFEIVSIKSGNCKIRSL